jgi:hypothetical protein
MIWFDPALRRQNPKFPFFAPSIRFLRWFNRRKLKNARSRTDCVIIASIG